MNLTFFGQLGADQKAPSKQATSGKRIWIASQGREDSYMSEPVKFHDLKHYKFTCEILVHLS